MTHEQVIGMIVIGVLVALFSRKRRPSMMIIETFEVVRERPKSRFLVNLVIVAVLGLIVWAGTHSQ